MPPLLSLETSSRAPYERLPGAVSASEDDDSVVDVDEDADGIQRKRKRWWSYVPLCCLLVLLFGPQYSVLTVLVSYYLQIHDTPVLFSIHLFDVCLLIFLACCSLLVCVVRDPGAIRVGEEVHSNEPEDEDEDEETELMDALRMPVVTKTRDDDDFNAPHKWCKKCWAPKPERTHHCSACGRCVLKMDHHCPWLASKCLGQWTYTAFLHFLLCITLLSAYICILSSRVVYVAFVNPFLVNERTALHALFLSIYGAIFFLVVGPFLLWHMYLVSTNQTTIENLSPFLLLRYLPPTNPATSPDPTTTRSPSGTLPQTTTHTPSQRQTSHFPSQSRNRLNNPAPIHPREHQLSSTQRRHVRMAHGSIRLYDVGFVENWRQVVGIGKRGWKGYGDGKSFPRNPRAESMLARLAAELENEDKFD
ncbi:hypothetical protein EW145_g5123 [Phellinidium pouzarii]|uniref:Palmitoyltransferase n=1 Tax=Phellinidium pouzarii TaxID=167371 RepID=A0A4S4L5Y7_9AGAM|nr:hypothetical protein EW145_g5123 [Phellinidium pouzarii]